MGGEDKKKNISKTSESRDHPKDVFNTSMSRLLQDFRSAELLSNTSDVPKGENMCLDSDCENVVSSMKYLHLRKPVISKHKQSSICVVKKKYSPNIFNLAFAACGYQRPIVWPARLSCHSDKSHSNVLRPPRLPVKKSETSDQDRAPSQNASLSVTEKSAADQNSVVFGNTSALDFSSLSFSSLSEHASKNMKDIKKSQEQGCSSLQTSCSAKSVCKRHCSSNIVPCSKLARTHVERNARPEFLTYRNSDLSYSCNRGNNTIHKHSVVGDEIPITTLSGRVAINQAANMSTTSSLETSVLISSTLASDQHYSLSLSDNSSYLSSQEQNFEETEANVNELASYFEDLLHIPRKMSIMAEMMYA